MRRRRSLRVRLTLLYGLVFLLAGTALVAIDYALLRHNLPNGTSAATTGQDVINRAQKLAADPGLSAADQRAMQEVAAATPATAASLAAHPDKVPVTIAKRLFADLPGDVRSRALHDLLEQSLLALGGVTVVAAGLGWLVAGRALRPLQSITDTAQRLSIENLDARINLRGPDDELKHLADTFDQMLARLDAAFVGQQRFVANASHELRTPLTIMRTELDVTMRRPGATTDELRRMGAVVVDTIDRTDRLITSLLALASGSQEPERVEPVDLAEIVHTAVARRRADAEARDITVTIEATADATANGDPGLLDRVADNLVDNAVRHNVDHGWVTVGTGLRSGMATLTVANGGDPIDPTEAATLFEPFRRLEATRREAARGVGLGLSIVRAIVLAHGGTVAAAPAGGNGLRVEVQLPAADLGLAAVDPARAGAAGADHAHEHPIDAGEGAAERTGAHRGPGDHLGL